jgi:SRSO17 transposase
MAGASIETTLELWASSLRDVKRRMHPLFTQDRVARSAEGFLDGLLGEERRKTGWMRAEMARSFVYETYPRFFGNSGGAIWIEKIG